MKTRKNEMEKSDPPEEPSGHLTENPMVIDQGIQTSGRGYKSLRKKKEKNIIN